MFEGYQVIGTARYGEEGGLFDLGKSLVGQKPLPYHGALVIKVEDGTVTSPGPQCRQELRERPVVKKPSVFYHGDTTSSEVFTTVVLP